MTRVLLLAAAVHVAALGCTTGPPTMSREPVAAAIARGADPDTTHGLDTRPLVGARATVPVERLDGSGELAGFEALAREPALEKAPCASCHSVPLDAMRHTGGDGLVRAHWGITLDHAAGDVMSCQTCHAPDPKDGLRMLGGRLVDVDHSYQVCAQCHSGAASDWLGGAHGKPAGGWAPPRIATSCTGCHDPHRPRFEPRLPARLGDTEK